MAERTLWEWKKGGLTSSGSYRLTDLAFYAREGGPFRKTDDTIPLSRIQSVRVERGFWQGLSGTGTLILVVNSRMGRNDTDEDTFEIDGVPSVDKVLKTFTQAIAQASRR